MTSFVLIFLFMDFALASDPPIVPETEIEISVWDLVGRKPHRPKPKQGSKPKQAKRATLPVDFGRNVAQALESQRAQLLGCLEHEISDKPRSLQVKLDVQPDGKALAQYLGREQETHSASMDCVKAVLEKTNWPTHSMDGPVAVKFPLVLEKRGG